MWHVTSNTQPHHLSCFVPSRQKQKVVDSDLASEQAHQYLVTKAKTRWSDLSKVRKSHWGPERQQETPSRIQQGERCPHWSCRDPGPWLALAAEREGCERPRRRGSGL